MTERIVGRPWTAQEDRLLANAVAIHGESDNWKAVAHCVPERTNKACRKRWLHSLSPNVKKSAWTPEEDHLLLELYKVHSTKWSVIARHIPGRTDDACSKRYREALDPSLRRDEWSKEEDDKLFDAYSRLAGRWGQVGQELQRSGLACRNRWRLLERKKKHFNRASGCRGFKTVVDYVFRTIKSYRSVAPTPSHTPVPAQRASEYYSPVPHHNECHHQLIRDEETSQSHLSQDSCYPTASQGSSAALVPTALGPTHEATDSYYVVHHRQQLEHDVQHVVMSSPDSSSVCSVSREYFPSSSSSDNCSPPPEARGDYYQPQLKGQLQPHFHPLSNEPKLNGHRAPMPVVDSGPPPTSPDFHPAPSAQRSASISPSAHTRLLTASVLPKAIGSGAKRGPPQDTSSPNPDDPNPRPTARPRQSFARKRTDIHAPLRLSSDLPATNDPSIKPYACGHESCWPVTAGSSLACYTTSRGLSDHNKSSHPEDSGGERPYRCGLDGCGKSWKSINGLQYHLQISKAHFQHAIVSTFVTSYIDGLNVPIAEASPGEGDDKTKKQYSCPHQGCPNRYKQLSGLRYHLAHGHPTDLPVQLDLVPPALSRKLAEKMRKDGTGSQPPETQTHKPLPTPAPSQSCSPGHVST
ncbi:hypothetical protein DFJ58DRAFT_655646 [Suillus subalutaceus]|uniref:uncharacterized protein n=1 Tax=Suillus subalutaceus TaxID=48586 RepID=UPI001B85D24E|nr:uncharacterized protein DFJ58DRAFT_655646 [Suillus subalutaceus]KAG1864642.1 hypothetical protein DFJ58DRAFT_655646 [Suillus subalutaceus]